MVWIESLNQVNCRIYNRLVGSPLLGLYSLHGGTSYCQIPWSLEAARCCNDRLPLKFDRHRQCCCRGACHISERLQIFKPESRRFETSRDLAIGVRPLSEKMPWGQSCGMTNLVGCVKWDWPTVPKGYNSQSLWYLLGRSDGTRLRGKTVFI